ncbi:MAG: hypothetical protein WAM60_24140 [Candidatus Promineifilaceae bacterium]
MTLIPIFIPVSRESKPLWEFEGDWIAEEKALLEGVLYQHSHKHKKPYRKRWLLICRRFSDDADYHATYGTEVALYGDTAEELGQRINLYYVTGKTSSNIFEFESTLPLIQPSRADDDWLNQIKLLHEEDKLRLQGEQDQEQERQAQARRDLAMKLLRQSKAHELLSQVQKALLNGKGILEFLDQSEEYDQAIVLMWQGSISAARNPDKANEDNSYILVGVRDNKIWINGTAMAKATPAALKVSLLEACKEPRRSRAS